MLLNDSSVALINNFPDFSERGFDMDAYNSFFKASNIIINALQAKKEDHPLEVNVALCEQGERIVISIQDNGAGMSDEVMGKVFQPQFTTKQSGSGLGLALTRQIVLHAGGKIWFESKVGKGTSFFIELPLCN